MKKILNNFTKTDIIIYSASIFLIVTTFLVFDRINYVNLITSLIGAISLIFIAKGNAIGQILSIVFSVFYLVISYKTAYFGETITYLFMNIPLAIISLVSWLKNPYEKNVLEVKVNKIKKREFVFAFTLTFIITFIFYFILKYFNTANLVFSTISIATSFIAVYLTFRRSEYYAIGYACNDIVLIVLWTLKTIENISYLSIVTCFIVFLANDIYGFISWTKMKKRQSNKY